MTENVVAPITKTDIELKAKVKGCPEIYLFETEYDNVLFMFELSPGQPFELKLNEIRESSGHPYMVFIIGNIVIDPRSIPERVGAIDSLNTNKIGIDNNSHFRMDKGQAINTIQAIPLTENKDIIVKVIFGGLSFVSKVILDSVFEELYTPFTICAHSFGKSSQLTVPGSRSRNILYPKFASSFKDLHIKDDDEVEFLKDEQNNVFARITPCHHEACSIEEPKDIKKDKPTTAQKLPKGTVEPEIPSDAQKMDPETQNAQQGENSIEFKAKTSVPAFMMQNFSSLQKPTDGIAQPATEIVPKSSAKQGPVKSVPRTTRETALRACLRCRSKKQKCGRQRPACSRCIDKDVSCAYPESGAKTLSESRASPRSASIQGMQGPVKIINTPTPISANKN